MNTITMIILSVSSIVNLLEVSQVLKQVETNNNTEVIGDNGRAYGVLQIHKICIDDVNRHYSTHYTHKDAFSEVCSDEIFNLYISMGIQLFCKRYGRDPNEEEIVRFWNGGIYTGHKKQATIPYYKKYLKYKHKNK
tara:strand:+ start:111 stop:518 length:408 start_codon:yes stop_codon:yes gene_type:complete